MHTKARVWLHDIITAVVEDDNVTTYISDNVQVVQLWIAVLIKVWPYKECIYTTHSQL